MKRKSVSVFLGIMFLLGGLVTFLLYGMHYGQAFLLFVGVLLLIPKPEADLQENAASVSEEELRRASEKRTAFYRDTKTVSFSVSGVTFSNEKGNLRSRQSILRRILFHDPPFDCDHSVTLEKYFFENEPAYYVKVNDYIIGNVPEEFIPWVDINADRPFRIDDFQVYGGRGGRNFGASLKIVYLDTLEMSEA